MAIEIRMAGSGGVDPRKLAKVKKAQTYKLVRFDQWSCLERSPNDKFDPPPLKLFEGMATMIKKGGKRKKRYLAKIKTSMSTKKVQTGKYKTKEVDDEIVLVKIPR